MVIHKIVASGAAAAMASTPALAQAVTPIERAGAQASDESDLGGRIGPAFVIIALAVAGMLFLILTDDDDDAVSA